MSVPVAASAMILSARQRSNLQGATRFIPDAEALDYLNGSISHWYDMVRLTTWGGQFYRSQKTITLVQGKTFYGVSDGFPSDLASLLSVDGFVTSGSSPVTISIMRYQEEQRNTFKLWPSVSITQSPVYCQLQGDGIAFLPVPFAGSSVGINYVPTAPQLISTNDTLETWNGWHEWLILDVAIKMLTKDGQTDIIPALMAQRAEQEQRIKQAVPARDITGPEIVHDVEGYGGSSPGTRWGY